MKKILQHREKFELVGTGSVRIENVAALATEVGLARSLETR